MIKNYFEKNSIRLILPLLLVFFICNVNAQTWINTNNDNNFSNPTNWSSGTFPTSTQNAVINSSGINKAILSSIIEIGPKSLQIGAGGSGELNIENGGVIMTTNSSGYCLVGNSSGNIGIVNQNSGAVIIASDIKIGAAGTGTWNLNNGVVKNTRGNLTLGGTGKGTFKISGGEYQSRAAVVVNNGGNFIVDGSGSDYISVGSNGSVDGLWTQASGGKVSFVIDQWGTTPIDIVKVDNSGNNGNVTFANGALLDVSFKSGVNISGSWDVMSWDGTLTDSGLAFTSTVDQSRWSFSFVDTNADGIKDVLRLTATANGTCTTNGIPFTWYQTYFPGQTNAAYEALDNVDSDGDGLINKLEFRSKSNPTDNGIVNNINDLKKYMPYDGVKIKMTAGYYPVTQADIINNVIKCIPGDKSQYEFLPFVGSNSTYDLTGVQIDLSTYYLSFPGNNGNTVPDYNTIHLLGSNNTIKGLQFNDVDDNYSTNLLSAGVSIVIDGNGNTLQDIKLTTRGSYPYGYGSNFGIGSTYTIAHKKHSALLVVGDNNTIKGVSITHRTFGHGFFVQGATNTTFEDCYVEGALRTTDDMLKETSGPAFNIDFMTTNGIRLEAGHMCSLSEDGIRAYATGTNYFTGATKTTSKITVKNCTIKNMRRGVHTNFTTGNNTVTGCTVLGVQETGFMPGNGDVISDCRGDALYSPLTFLYYTSNKNLTMDLKIIRRPPSEYYGNNTIAYLAGSSNKITISEESTCDAHDDYGRILISGLNDAYGFNSDLSASNITLTNNSRYAVEIGAKSTTAKVTSVGAVTNTGTGSTITAATFVPLNCCGVYNTLSKIEAENYCTMSGIQQETCNDGGLAIGYVNNGDWAMYKDIDLTNQKSIVARFATIKTGGSIEFRMDSVDGALIGTMAIPTTEGWQTWLTTSTNIINTSASGVHDIYLVFKGGGSYLYNLNWFGFSEDLSILKTDNYNLEKPFIISPNPINNEFNIVGHSGAYFTIFNALGSTVLEGKISNDIYNVVMDNYPSGVYFITIKENKRYYSSKLIKK